MTPLVVTCCCLSGVRAAQVMFALFTVLCGVWAWYCWQNRQYAHRIHLLMGLLCAFKALTVMSQAGM